MKKIFDAREIFASEKKKTIFDKKDLHITIFLRNWNIEMHARKIWVVWIKNTIVENIFGKICSK